MKTGKDLFQVFPWGGSQPQQMLPELLYISLQMMLNS
jgi:hypothetical protein